MYMEGGFHKQENTQFKEVTLRWRGTWTYVNGKIDMEQAEYPKTQLYLLDDYAKEVDYKGYASS